MKRLVSFLGLLIAYSFSLAAQDAPMFRGNLQHTGVYDAGGVPQFKAVQWKFHTAGRVISSPAVVNGVIYVGSTDCNLYAIDAASGEMRWKFETKGWVVSSPAVDSGVVYFLSYDSYVYAVDAASGQLKWKFQTGARGIMRESTFIICSRHRRACRIPGTFIFLRPARGMGRCTSAVEMGMFTPWMRNRAN